MSNVRFVTKKSGRRADSTSVLIYSAHGAKSERSKLGGRAAAALGRRARGQRHKVLERRAQRETCAAPCPKRAQKFDNRAINGQTAPGALSRLSLSTADLQPNQISSSPIRAPRWTTLAQPRHRCRSTRDTGPDRGGLAVCGDASACAIARLCSCHARSGSTIR